MAVYREVPHWWFGVIAVVATVFLCVAAEIEHSQLPIWAVFFGIALSALTTIPLAMLQAITNQQITLNVMFELIIGYILPGRPIANAIFKSLTVQGNMSALAFAGDLKLGHYMKIPPRILFSIQMVSLLISCFVVIGVQEWSFAHIPDLCDAEQADGFVCNGTNVFATATLIWGGIGPKRMFQQQ